MLCRPFVELLAFVGLQEFRLRGSKDRGFGFALWRPAPYLIARLAFGGHGRHVLGRLRARTAKSGSYTFLRYAEEISENERSTGDDGSD